MSVSMESDPPGAEVWIDRKYYGKTPGPLKLRAGFTFEIYFAKSGYRLQRVLYAVTSRQGQRLRVVMVRQ